MLVGKNSPALFGRHGGISFFFYPSNTPDQILRSKPREELRLYIKKKTSSITFVRPDKKVGNLNQ